VEEIKLDASEMERYGIVQSCINGEITNATASIRLGLKKRQVQNLKRAVRRFGKKGLIHGLKGKPANHSTCIDVVEDVVAFLKEKKHSDFGPTFASEKLVERGMILNRETLRKIMIRKKLWKPHLRKGPQIVREWRERKECFGELVQFDGSYHDWFEDDGEECLLAAIDDATSLVVKAQFENDEGVYSVFRFWWSYLEAYGCPRAIYLDKFSTYKVNHKNATDNAEFMTQFKRAMTELDIKLISANSPEAKGRVERLFGTLQDRLVKEMRLLEIKDRDIANQFLEEKYLINHNDKFSVVARSKGNAHRPLTDELKRRLSSIFSVQSKRRVNNDYTIQFKNYWYQLEPTQDIPVYKRDEITTEEHLDGTIHLRLKDTCLRFFRLPNRPKLARISVPVLTKAKLRTKPPEDHPWRRATRKAVLEKLARRNTKNQNTNI